MAPYESQSEKNTNAVDKLLTRNGGLTYLEIPAVDPILSATFYEKVLGWKVDVSDASHPKFMDPTGHLLGRFRTGRAIAREPGFLPYIYADKIDDVISRVTANGGEVVKASYLEGNLLVATIRDPAGNLIGLWQSP